MTREGGFAAVFSAAYEDNRRKWSSGIVGYVVCCIWPFLRNVYVGLCWCKSRHFYTASIEEDVVQSYYVTRK